MHPTLRASQALTALRAQNLPGRVGEMTAPSFTAWDALALAGAVSGIYHGYKRNHGSVGWGLGWGVFGGMLPIVSIPLSIAEGFGKPA